MAASSSATEQPINIDDSDTNDVQYQTPNLWTHQQGQPNYQGGTYSEGFTNARAEFRFNGTDVTVYGVAHPRPSSNTSAASPAVSFAVDGAIPLTVVSDPGVQSTVFAHQYYDSRTLPATEHVLQINVMYAEGDWPFVLDYIQYVPLPPRNDTQSTTSASRSGGGGGSKGKQVGAIVGGVMGGVGVLALAVLVWYYVHIRRRASGKTTTRGAYIYTSADKVDLLDGGPKTPPTIPIPVPALPPELLVDLGTAHLHQHTQTASSSHDDAPSSPPPVVLVPNRRVESPAPVAYTYRPATPESVLPRKAREIGAGAGDGGGQRVATFYEDSGVRFKAGELLPPVDPTAQRRRPARVGEGSMKGKKDGQGSGRRRVVNDAASAISEVPPMYTEQ